jgi:hypothetical protein
VPQQFAMRAEVLLVFDSLHDLTHFHGAAGWDFLKRERELIRGDPGQALKHRPKLLQHVWSSLPEYAASQHTIKRGGRSFLSTGKS